MRILTLRKLEVTEYGYLVETTTYYTLIVWLRRKMVLIDKSFFYTILNA